VYRKRIRAETVSKEGGIFWYGESEKEGSTEIRAEFPNWTRKKRQASSNEDNDAVLGRINISVSDSSWAKRERK
jgi:hypothetical protein